VQYFAVEVVYHIETPELPATHQRIAYKVNTPSVGKG
jgi:hypothetical protein